LFASAVDVAFGVAFNIVTVIGVGSLFAFALAGPDDVDLSLFHFIASSPMLSSSGSSGINGDTVGIGLVAIAVGMIIGLLFFLNLIVLFVARFVLVSVVILGFLCMFPLVGSEMLV